MAEDDAELVALIDNELDEGRRTALLARLAADEQLRERYEELRQTGAPLAASFDELLTQAPLARLRAALPVDSPARRPRIALRDLAAGLVGILVGGAAVWVALSSGLFGEGRDWRKAVVGYANLYSNETFSPFNPDASLQATELSALGARVGVNLTPESVALPGLRFTVAFMLSYYGAPLGVVAYVDPSGEPVLLCIFANDAPDAPIRSERREKLSLAWWSRGGRSRLVVGRIPEEQAVALAQMLEKRI
jgi:anti-sigma factor RsiW